MNQSTDDEDRSAAVVDVKHRSSPTPMVIDNLIQALVVSPHLDDAALSAGAAIAAMADAGATIEVATLFAGLPDAPLSPAAARFHEMCSHPLDASAMLLRREEDVVGTRELCVNANHGGFLDAVYRRKPDGSWLCQHAQGMFEPNPLPEPILERELASFVGNRCDVLRPDVLLTCAGIGGHIDHGLTSKVVTLVGRRRGIRTVLWEDLPYAVDKRVSPPEVGLRTVEDITDEKAWAKKWRAIAAYASQVWMLWGDADWRITLEGHGRSRGDGSCVEIIWEAPT